MNDEATILVVDDQAQNIRLLDAVLSPRGYRVLTAESGEEALDLLREEQPHVVLLDIMMPGMDGYEVCRRIRENPDTAYLPVVMITASDTQEKVRAIEAGADDFVTKPFDQAELLARVKSLVRVKRYQDTIRRQAASWRHGTVSWRSASSRRSRRSSGQLASAASSRRRWPSSSSIPATSPSSRATVARSWSCSAISVSSPRSPSRASPRSSWRC